MIETLEKSLILFFYKCEDIITSFKPSQKYHINYIKSSDSWEESIIKINDWTYRLIEKEIITQIKSIKEIEPCLNLLEKILEPKSFLRGDVNDKRPYREEETSEANRKSNSYELIKLFFRFKEKKEIDSNVTLESFSKAMADFAFSNENVSHYKAQLIGFMPKDFNEANFGKFKIQRISEDEKLEMMNKFEAFFSNLTPLNIVNGFDGAWTYDYWITGKVKKVLKGKRSTFFHAYWDESFSEVVEELTTIIKILRIGSGIDLGIRNFYAKSTYPNECPIYDKWYYQKYGFGNYAVFERKDSGGSSRQYELSLNKDFTKNSLQGIRRFSELFEKYKFQQLEQINLAIKYYTEAFEVNFAIYCFTSLMMAFEALLNAPPDKSNKPSKEQTLILLKEIIYNVEYNNKSMNKQLKKINRPLSINEAISIGKKIYSKEKQFQDEFNNFFNPESGCFKLRNKLVHGHFDSKITTNITKILPKLNSYIRDLIEKIIELTLNGALDCIESNYYEKLEQYVKSE